MDANLKFYLLKDKRDYVFAVKILDNISLEKIRYSLQGVVMSHVTHSISNDIVLRKSGEREVAIDGNKIVSLKQNIKLKPLERPNTKALFVEDSNVGVIDIETYLADDGTYKVYALGLETYLSDSSTIYYIDKYSDLDSSKIVLSLVNVLLRSKCSNVTFYCHNLGGYDIVLF